MGLDLEPLGRAKPGNEAEWEKLLLRLYAGDQLAKEELERLPEISIPPYSDIGAPRVGHDAEANIWLLARARQAGETKSDAEIIASNTGYYVVELLHGKSDGVPSYSNAAFGYVAATSFRGEFLESCTAFLDQTTIDLAWRSVIPPPEAMAYGRFLLAALDRPAANPPLPGVSQPGTLVPVELSVQEQRQIIDEAGRWYVFWGQRGNPIWANF